MFSNNSSPKAWARDVFGSACLGDQRRTSRLVEVVGALAEKPLNSFCQTYPKWRDTKAAYRLIENKNITPEQFQEPSEQAAANSCRGQKVVLAISDTTSLNFTSHRATSGLGPISEIAYQGILFHSTIVVRKDGVPLGLLRQEAWVRDPKEHGKRHQRKQRKIEDKESYRWVKSILESSESMDSLSEQDRPYMIHIFDREGDIYEVFEAIEDSGDGAIIRSSWNRKISNEHKHIHDQVLNSRVLGREIIDIPRKQGERKRKTTVEYRACMVMLCPKKDHRPIEINVVAVVETNPPDGIEPLKWMLVTTEPIDTLDEVCEIVRLYTIRWRIEEYHLILKSGCRMEKVQFETADRIMKILAIFAAVALRLLQMTYQARIDPDLPCTAVISENEWRALQTYIQGKPPSPKTRPPTLKQAILWIGKLGGHLGRKSDGMPGVRTLWRGWRDLQVILSMYLVCRDHSTHL